MTTNCDRNISFTDSDRTTSASTVYRGMYGLTTPGFDLGKVEITTSTQDRRIDITKVPVPMGDNAPSALKVQAGGDHYVNSKIQPIEFIHANNIPFCEANVIKYVFRWKTKNGLEDLKKARHYIDLLIELESKNV